MLYLSKYYKFKYIDKVLFKYHQHSSNTIRSLEAIDKKDTRTRLSEQATLRSLRLNKCLPDVAVFARKRLRELEGMRGALLKGTVVQQNVSYYIDSKVFENKGTYIWGWAFCGNEVCQVFIKSRKTFYETIMRSRPDVRQAFNLNNDMQGFSAFIPVELDNFSLYLVNMARNEVYVCDVENEKNN